MSNKIGVIDVGGGCRGAYAAGVFDYFLDNKITFDCCFLSKVEICSISSLDNSKSNTLKFSTILS